MVLLINVYDTRNRSFYCVFNCYSFIRLFGEMRWDCFTTNVFEFEIFMKPVTEFHSQQLEFFIVKLIMKTWIMTPLTTLVIISLIQENLEQKTWIKNMNIDIIFALELNNNYISEAIIDDIVQDIWPFICGSAWWCRTEHVDHIFWNSIVIAFAWLNATIWAEVSEFRILFIVIGIQDLYQHRLRFKHFLNFVILFISFHYLTIIQ